jgi:hypothetical protein
MAIRDFIIHRRDALSCVLATAFALIACPGIAGPANTTKAPAKSVNCWELLQENRTFGPMKMDISPQCARVEISNMHVIVVCTKPSWRVSIFNPATKQELSSSIEEWEREGFPMDERKGNGVPIEKGTESQGTYAGMKAAVYKYHCNFKERDVGSRAFTTFTGGTYYAASEVPLPRPEIIFLRALMRTPAIVGSIPLGIILDSSKGTRPIFKTTSVAKVKLAASDFSYPKGFKQVSTGSQLAMSYLRTKMDLIQEFAGEMSGAATDARNAKKQQP